MRQTHAAHPFVMMTDPEAILEAVERSERLNRLRRHVCRPLDRPLIPKRSQDAEAFDREIDQENEVALDAEADAFAPLAG